MEMTEAQKEHSVLQLTRMLELLGFPAEVVTTEGEDGFALHLKAEDPGRLIGRKGHYLQSMELLLNRMMRKKYERVPWVGVDVDGYRRKSRTRGGRQSSAEREHLEKVALDAATEVKRWGQPKRIGPFGARDRRVIHMVLKDDADVETVSGNDEGDGMKMVVIQAADKHSV